MSGSLGAVGCDSLFLFCLRSNLDRYETCKVPFLGSELHGDGYATQCC